MQERINLILNRPFTVFLACRKGRIYFIWMIFIFVFLANFIQRFGLTATSHEYHKPLIISNYIVLFFVMYALVYMLLSYFRPNYYKIWTIRKEFSILFLIFIPATAFTTCLFVIFSVPAFKLTLPAFIELQFYNFILSIFSIPTFGYFVHTQFNPNETTQSTKLKEKTKSKSHHHEEQVLNIIQKLNELMEINQLYLSEECNEQQIAGITGFSVHNISEAVNTYYHKNFSEFINEYRCKLACQMLEDNIPKRMNIEVIGDKCGFKNRVSFQNAFKKIYGINPSEYQEKVNRE